MVEKRRQRRTLTAQLHIRCTEIPDHRHAQPVRHHRAIANLKRALPPWRMGQCLTVETYQIHIREIRQYLQMRRLDHTCRRLHSSTGPLTEPRRDHAALLRAVIAIAAAPEGVDVMPVRAQHRHIHTVQ